MELKYNRNGRLMEVSNGDNEISDNEYNEIKNKYTFIESFLKDYEIKCLTFTKNEIIGYLWMRYN